MDNKDSTTIFDILPHHERRPDIERLIGKWVIRVLAFAFYNSIITLALSIPVCIIALIKDKDNKDANEVKEANNMMAVYSDIITLFSDIRQDLFPDMDSLRQFTEIDRSFEMRFLDRELDISKILVFLKAGSRYWLRNDDLGKNIEFYQRIDCYTKHVEKMMNRVNLAISAPRLYSKNYDGLTTYLVPPLKRISTFLANFKEDHTNACFCLVEVVKGTASVKEAQDAARTLIIQKAELRNFGYMSGAYEVLHNDNWWKDKNSSNPTAVS